VFSPKLKLNFRCQFYTDLSCLCGFQATIRQEVVQNVIYVRRIYWKINWVYYDVVSYRVLGS
jgi:hypothetical protein